MIKKLITIIALIGIFGTVGCRDIDNQSSSGACGLNIISDYNSTALACRSSFDSSKCRLMTSQFLTKYPKVNCAAETQHGLTKERITVNKDRIDQLVKANKTLVEHKKASASFDYEKPVLERSTLGKSIFEKPALGKSIFGKPFGENSYGFGL